MTKKGIEFAYTFILSHEVASGRSKKLEEIRSYTKVWARTK